MTIGEILFFVFFMLGLFLGYNWGKAEGEVKGRKAVRRYYEQAGR